LTIVNLDYRWPQSGFVELPLKELGIDVRHPYRMVDLLTGAKFDWQGSRNYVELRPHEVPAHTLRKEDPPKSVASRDHALPETKGTI
jgi:starch synthase (maltosyl-transferring)